MMKIGTHVWSKAEWSGNINESIIVAIDRIVLEGKTVQHAKLKGISVPGSHGELLENLYLSKEEAIASEHKKSRLQIEKYKEELHGTTNLQTMQNMICFAYKECVASSEEYTNWEARIAYTELAEELHIFLD